VGFVVEEFPLREEVMSNRADGEVGVAKGFNTGAKKGVFKAKIDSTLPDDTTDVKGVGTTNTDTGFSLSDNVLGLLR